MDTSAATSSQQQQLLTTTTTTTTSAHSHPQLQSLSQASPLSALLTTGRSLDQQVDHDISPNHSNYSNLSNSSCSNNSATSRSRSSNSSTATSSGGASNDTSPTCSSSSSAPQYSADIRRTIAVEAAAAGAAAVTTPTTLPTLPRQGSAGSNSIKTCEVDLGDEERDTFSPISSSQCSPCEAATAIVHCNGAAAINNVSPPPPVVLSATAAGVDNKIFESTTSSTAMTAAANKLKIPNGYGSAPSKAEKQRQNEEIVCMETSTISTETGSWESVYPQMQATAETTASASTISNTVIDVAGIEELNEHDKLKPQPPPLAEYNFVDDCAPYLRERTYSTGATADTSSLFKGLSSASLLREFDKREQAAASAALSTSGTSACFIDASSLRDEDEVLSFPSLDGVQQAHDEASHQEEGLKAEEDQHAKEDEEEASPTKQLEEFHKAFARCKSKTKPEPEPAPDLLATYASSSSNSGATSPQKEPLAESTNNLSDEEKLWKRCQHTNDLKEVVNVEPAPNSNPHEDATEASVSLAADLDSSDSSMSVRMRGEQAARARPVPYTSFQHNLQQFSIHPLGTSPKFSLHHHTHPSATLGANGATSTAANGTAQNDLSYTTDYSSSSPAPSLVWSEHEQRPSYGNAMSLRQQQQQQQQQFHSHSHSLDMDTKLHCQLPDTPHNSIIHIEPMSSNTSSIHRDYTLSSSLSHHRDSGAYCSDATDSPIPMPRTPKRSKFDEANPIVSGGASIEDYNNKHCESPTIKRRTDTCPIVSGGFVSLDFEATRPLHDDDDDDDDDGDIGGDGCDDDDIAGVELRAKPKTRKPIPGIASWVVDMSDCRPERRKSTSSASSSVDSLTPAKFRERADSTSSHKSGCGFYVSLDDMDKKPPPNAAERPIKSEMSKSYTAPKSAGFFVNISQSDYQVNKEHVVAESDSKPEEASAAAADKKNIFSIFIDFGDKKPRTPAANGKKEPFSLAQRLTSSLTSAQRRNGDEPIKSSASSTETLMAKSANLKPLVDEAANESKSLDYMCNLEPPITVAAIRRLSQQQRAQNDPSKRHSWGNNPKQAPETDYKRSMSLTANGDAKDHASGSGLMSIIDKLPIISKASSLSVDSSLSPMYDDYTGSKSGMSTCSNNSARNSMSGGELRDENAPQQAARIKKRRRDVQINETFDKSSVASITDGVLSKDLSPASTTDTDDLTFQQDEELALREAAMQQAAALQPMNTSNRTSTVIMETIIEAKETSSPKKNVSSNGHTMESLHATIEKQKMLLETVNEHAEVGKSSFVKLSDMDKPVKHDLNSPDSMSKSVGNGNHRQLNRLFRDENKTRPHSWSMTRSTGNSFLNITNSVDNLRSLSRLFPNFSKEFSNSLPNDMVLDQMDYIQTDLSADSSLASSFSRSGMDESSISCRQPRRLGEDLLKMFLQEIATDMIVEVHGRRIRAHKCILRSRCQYFAAMLAGHGATSVVSLQGYSYSAVHFALCHIYSGASHPPDGISLMELAALADLLGLEGLKEVTSHALKTNYCHNFHKPCSGCIDGILQVLPVALNHALDDLYRKCLRWTCRHYLKVWPTRQFSQLPHDILGRCRQQIVAYLTSESVLDTVLDCDHLLAQLSAYRWGGTCENLVRDILDAAYAYVADHFASLIASDAFLSLGHDRSRHIPRLESVLLQTASSLTADQACRSYQRITRLNTVLQAKVIQMPANMGELAKELQGLQDEELDWDPEYIRLVSALLSAVEQGLIRQCSRAMRITAWQRMDLDLRKKIQTLARLTEPLDMKRNSKPVGKAFSFGGNTRNQDLIQVKLAIQAHTKRALAQDTQLYKATQTQDACNNVQTAERGVQANNDVREGNSKVLKSNSRVHVPQAYRAGSLSANVSERNSINLANINNGNGGTTHRRTQSEVPAALQSQRGLQKSATETKVNAAAAVIQPTKPQNARLADVRPRYLEPRKTRSATGPVRSVTSSSIPGGVGAHAKPSATSGKGLHISSSDSSRNSSPAAARRQANSNKIGNKSTNMSTDSLTSPARRAKSVPRGKVSDTERYSDVNADSMTESMKSSVVTNKTISHESLPSGGAGALGVHTTHRVVARANQQLNMNNNNTGAGSKSTTTTTAASKRLNIAGNKSTRQLRHQRNTNSNGSSPSSVQTNKSATSRLSSVSSTHSTRDVAYKRSISVPAASSNDNSSNGGGTQRRSFLSAKSREILAKRAEKNKLQQQQQQLQQVNSSGDEQQQTAQRATAGPMRSASHSAVSAAAAQYNQRNAMPSNIPTRRPNTLHLKKTTNASNKAHVVPITHAHNNNIGSSSSSSKDRKQLTNGSATNVIFKPAHAVKQKLDLLIDAASMEATQQPPMKVETPVMRVESKLERSSTFCKEYDDFDANELHIVE